VEGSAVVEGVHTRRARLYPTKAGNRMRRAETGAFSQRGVFSFNELGRPAESVCQRQIELELVRFEPPHVAAVDTRDPPRGEQPQT
jgi:hypothetical protein